jgi:hypothetical protein
VNAAAGVVQAAMQNGRQTAAGIALALDSAQMLMSPGQATELAEAQRTTEALRARLAVLEGQRAALAERLRAGQTWRQGQLVTEDLVPQSELRTIFEIPLAAPLDGITRLTVPVLALREAEPEGEHYPAVHHGYLVPRDLPPLDAVPRSLAEPQGCSRCGVPQREHMQRWKKSLSGDGWHQWIAPSQAQIKARMLARRNARKAVCRCPQDDDVWRPFAPVFDPYQCEADDCHGYTSESNPFAIRRSVHEPSAKVSRKCGQCAFRTSVWHVDDGSAEEELHGHIARTHGGTAPVAEGAGA